MEQTPLEKGIILRNVTGRYNHVSECDRKKISWKTIKEEGLSEERKF
jgi:hypothetical protein